MKSKINSLFYLLLCLFLMIGPIALFAEKPAALYEKANKLYMDQNYAEAAVTYEKILKQDIATAEIFYNLGNAYYKTGNVAASILNYERALRLSPSDEDIAYNLKIAYLNTIDKIEPSPMVFYEKWWNDFVNGGSLSNRAIISVACFWVGLLFAAGYFFSGKVFVRKIMFFSGSILITSGLFLLYLTYLQNNHLNSNKGAVVFSDSAYIKSSPDNSSSNLFMLHSGTRVDVIDELKEWKKIRIANGNEGWVQKDAIEII